MDENLEALEHLGGQTAQVLKGYGHPAFAKDYQDTLSYGVILEEKMLEQSRQASTLLQEGNHRLAHQPGHHPHLQPNKQLQAQLEGALSIHAQLKEEQQQVAEDFFKRPVSTPGKPLENAAQQVDHYLRLKDYYGHQEERSPLAKTLTEQLAAYRTAPNTYATEQLVANTQAGIQVMRADYEERKADRQQDLHRRLHLDSGYYTKAYQEEAARIEQGLFRMPNQEQGHLVAQRADDAQQQLTQHLDIAPPMQQAAVQEARQPSSAGHYSPMYLHPNFTTNPNQVMEQEKTNHHQEDLYTVGKQAADALRGYGYTDFAQEYERALHRSALNPKEVLTHSRIASNTLKELNNLSTEKHGKHLPAGRLGPALETNVALQERLDKALQTQQQLSAEKPKTVEDLSFPAKMYLEENSKPLDNAAREVANYLEEKRIYSHVQEGKTSLQKNLDLQLNSYQSLPTAYNMEQVEAHTKAGIQVMKQDFEQAKATIQKENEDYVRDRHYLSPEGKAFILKEAEQGEFMMPNKQKGHIVASRAEYAEQQLNQYTRTKEQIISIDEQRTEGPAWKQALSSPAIDKDSPEIGAQSADKADAWKSTLQQDYPHLSAEQQERFANLQSKVISVEPSKDQEMER